MSGARSSCCCALLAAMLPLAAQGTIGFAQADNAHSRSLVSGGFCYMDTVVASPMDPAPEWSGGDAAIDRRRFSAWISNGTELQEWSLDGFQPMCTAAPSLVLKTAQTHVSGLAYDVARDQLIQLETNDGVAALRFYALHVGSACLSPVGSCEILLADRSVRATAVAIDGRRDVLWIAARRAGAHVGTDLLVYDRGSCERVCAAIAAGGVDAMSYDEANDELWTAAGSQMLRYRVTWGRGCPRLDLVDQCELYHPAGQRLRGFDLKRGHGIPASMGCTGPGCAACSPLLDPVGMPVVGNAAFALRLSKAPSGGFATLWMKPAPAAPTPYGCGSLLTPPDQSVAFAVNVPIVGALPCDGIATLPLPLPLDYSLIGQHYVQATIVCPALGIGLSNATLLFVDSE